MRKSVHIQIPGTHCIWNLMRTVHITKNNWTASSEFGTYRLCEQRRFRRSRQNLCCSLIQAVSQEEPSDRKPDPWPLWMAGHAQLKFVMTECSKTQIRLTGLSYLQHSRYNGTPMETLYSYHCKSWYVLCSLFHDDLFMRLQFLMQKCFLRKFITNVNVSQDLRIRKTSNLWLFCKHLVLMNNIEPTCFKTKSELFAFFSFFFLPFFSSLSIFFLSPKHVAMPTLQIKHYILDQMFCNFNIIYQWNLAVSTTYLIPPCILKYKHIYWSKYLQSVEWSKYLHYQPWFTRCSCLLTANLKTLFVKKKNFCIKLLHAHFQYVCNISSKCWKVPVKALRGGDFTKYTLSNITY